MGARVPGASQQRGIDVEPASSSSSYCRIRQVSFELEAHCVKYPC